jgi:hypothetical protein
MTIDLREHLDLSVVLSGREVVASSVGPRGDAMFLAVDPKDARGLFGRIRSAAGALFPRTLADRPYRAIAVRASDDGIEAVTLDSVRVTFPHVQPLNNGGVLVVSPRCCRRSGMAEQNAEVFDAHGTRFSQTVFGDGIQDVQVDLNGEVWVSYFDEGIFGNYGWDEPIGAPGLIRFDTRGNILWKYSPPPDFGVMADCYALNVADDATWLCYYTDFPLVRIDRSGQATAWNGAVAGARTFATSEEAVLFFGGYMEDGSRLALQRFTKGRLTEPVRLDLSGPQRETLLSANVVGRGSILHAFVGAKWFQLDVREL